MQAKDMRMNKTTEALDNILLIKFNSWIERFIKIVQDAWSVEEKWLRRRFNQSILNNAMINLTQPMLALVIFATSVLWLKAEISLG